eukprot:3910660-Rhodomonas_salina.1
MSVSGADARRGAGRWRCTTGRRSSRTACSASTEPQLRGVEQPAESRQRFCQPATSSWGPSGAPLGP